MKRSQQENQKMNKRCETLIPMHCLTSAHWLQLHCRLERLPRNTNATPVQIYKEAMTPKWLKVFKNPLVFFTKFQPHTQKVILRACAKVASSLLGDENYLDGVRISSSHCYMYKFFE